MAKMAQFKAHLKNASNFSFLSEMMEIDQKQYWKEFHEIVDAYAVY